MLAQTKQQKTFCLTLQYNFCLLHQLDINSSQLIHYQYQDVLGQHWQFTYSFVLIREGFISYKKQLHHCVVTSFVFLQVAPFRSSKETQLRTFFVKKTTLLNILSFAFDPLLFLMTLEGCTTLQSLNILSTSQKLKMEQPPLSGSPNTKRSQTKQHQDSSESPSQSSTSLSQS